MITLIHEPDFADVSAKSSANLRNHFVLSLVEKGWAGARRLSIDIVQRGGVVRHVVRGRLDADLRSVLTPYPRMTIRGVALRWYWPAAWLELAVALAGGGPRLILVDNEKAAAWVGGWFPMLRERIVVVQEGPDGAPVIARRGAEASGL